MKVFALAVLAAGFMTSASANAATNLVTNGGFESAANGPTSGSNSSYYNIGPASADHAVPGDFGWNVPTNNVDIISYQAYGPAPTNGGSYGLDLVGYGSTGAISQTISTVAGQKYNVSFDYSSNPGIADPMAIVTFNGGTVGSVTGGVGWQAFNGVFTGTGSPNIFALSETFGGNNGGVFLDNISISAVPEPSTWAMLLLGFGAIGWTMRSNRRRLIARAA
jgi:hypothetical protein